MKNWYLWYLVSSWSKDWITNCFRKFNSEDAGVYIGSIYIDKKGEIFKCTVEIEIELIGNGILIEVKIYRLFRNFTILEAET